MTASVPLLVGAIVAGWLIPAMLRKLDMRRVDPTILLIAWLTAAVSVLATAAIGAIVPLLPSHQPDTAGIVAALTDCWEGITEDTAPAVEAIAGLLGMGFVLVALTRLAVIAVRRARTRARTRREHLVALRLSARCEGHSPAMLWLTHDRPMAFSFGGRPGVVVATEGLRRHLTPAEVRAVLAHERAHLRGRHHVLIATVQALAEALPFVPLLRELPAAVRSLVELAADGAAVRACGADAVRSALAGLAGHGTPHGALAMANHDLELRLARLSRSAAGPAGRVRRVVAGVMTGSGTLSLPTIAGTVLISTLAMAICPFTP